MKLMPVLLTLALGGPVAVMPEDLGMDSLAITDTWQPEGKFLNAAIFGNWVEVEYSCTIQNSGVLLHNSSMPPNAETQIGTGPLVFKLGDNMKESIEGLHRAVVGMRPGTKRKAIVPPSLAFGDSGAISPFFEIIPPGSWLDFELTLVKIMHTQPQGPDTFTQIDTNSDGVLSQPEVAKFFSTDQEFRLQHLVATNFHNQDIDKDGIITKDEFRGPKTKPTDVYFSVDADGDGQLTRQEVLLYYRKEQAKELTMRVDNAMQDDVNGDLALTWTEFSGNKPKNEPAHTLQRALLEVDAAGGQLGGRDAEHYEL